MDFLKKSMHGLLKFYLTIILLTANMQKGAQ